MMFDEIGFQQERFALAGGGDEIKVVDPSDHLRDTDAAVARAALLKIRCDPFTQRFGLADIQHPAGTIAKNIDTGLVRQAFEKLPVTFFHRRHGAHRNRIGLKATYLK
jgi:hypothetical protein